jgi:hypothetical protein
MNREDARTQIQKAVDYYTRVFGRPPRGMWPSEGSVSEDIVPLFAEAGIRWVATDEEILFRTLGNTNSSRRPLFKAYNVNVFDSSVNMVFRDHGLSDAIGFVYTRWRAEDAVADFMKRLYAIRDSLSDSLENNLVSVILDGENCWEYYANDGWDFLRLLYQTLANDPTIETVTLSDYLDRCPPKDTLKSLWAGSWINGNFGVWIGHAEDNLAWDYLNETRSFLTDFIARNPEKKDSPAVRSAWEQIYIAEGSDWNWWYGDDHSSSNDEMFDFLFRQHLISVYELLGERVPDYLRRAIKGIARKKPPALEPVDFLKPRIDGRITDYFEWQAAGCYKVGHSGGTMHQVETIIKSFYYGFDLNNLYFRFDLNITPASYRATDTLGFKIVFLAPAGHEVSFFMEKGGEIKQFSLTSPSGPETATTIAADKIVELAIPLAKLALPEDLTHIEFVVLVMKNGLEVERWPYESSVTMPKPSDDFSMQSWSV